ncbi:MAG: hypothetical protein JXR78_01585 [Victivallales bacterium]|nr:hypothetical protein [Victivallales bacterium]
MYSHKAVYRDTENITAFLQTFGVGRGRTMFITFTTRKNEIDKNYVAKALHNFITLMNRKSYREKVSNIGLNSNFQYICVWEKQSRGAWHAHLLVHFAGWSVKGVRRLIRLVSAHTDTPFKFVFQRWTYGRDAKALSKYMSKYLTKETRLKGVRYVSYSRNWVRRVKGAFSWAGGKSKLWRERCAILNKSLPHVFKFFYDHAGFDDKSQVVYEIWEADNWLFTPLDFVLSWIDKHAPSFYSWLADSDILGYLPELNPVYDAYPVGSGKIFSIVEIFKGIEKKYRD